ncbi:procyclic acidic repetitive family protein, partial [Bacillus rugosus]|uniref:hypothetical protein n=1 Tax=Bacillus rugosus TaxID=2715209 RepID=UPI002DBED5F2
GPESEPEDGPESEPEDGPESEPEDGPESEPEDGPKSEPEDGPKSEPEDGPKSEPETNKSVILKVNTLKIEAGIQVYLKDPTIINCKKVDFDELKIIPERQEFKIDKDDVFLGNNAAGNYQINYFLNDIKETLLIKVKKRKVTGIESVSREFFKDSNHFVGNVDLSEINDIVKQLYDLEYNDKYLLYVISFRAILEDLTKEYLNKQRITLSGNLKDNIISMLLDLQEVLKTSKKDPLKDEKLSIKQKFKGHDALNNFIIGVNVKFNNENYDKFLHSLTHNPAMIHRDLALEIANDLILPLYTLDKLLTEKRIIPSLKGY